MSRKHKLLALLAKIETTYGTSSVPTGSADAIQASNVEFTPLAGEEVSRDLMLPYLGHQGVFLTGNYVRVAFDVEMAGAGTAGDVPAYGALLRACGMNETVTSGTSVAYKPVSSGEEAATLFYNQDGVNHVMLGARGNVQMTLAAKQLPRFRFTMTALEGTIADTALPTVDLSDFQQPVPVSKAVTTLSLHGAPRIAETISIDLGTQITPEHLIGLEEIMLTDRTATGSCTLRAKDLATVNWFAIANARTRAALAIQHGTQAGNIVAIDAPRVEIGRPAQGNTNNQITYTLPMMLVPDAGNDELVITVK